MTEPAELPWDQKLALAKQVSKALLDAALAQRAIPQPGENAPLTVVHEALVRTRIAMDQLENLYGQAMALKVAAEAAAVKEERAEQDAWDDQADAARKRGITQYEGAQERYAIYRIKTRDQRAIARIARDVADVAVATERRIQVMHRGLDGARLDLHRRLNVLAVIESPMERA